MVVVIVIVVVVTDMTKVPAVARAKGVREGRLIGVMGGP